MLKLGSRLARWIALLIAISGTSAAFAQSTGTIQGITYQGGVTAAVSGLQSTNYLDGVVPFATVCVYFTGTTTLAPIFADAKNTPRNSCFTSDSLGTLLPGHFIFWAAVGQGYDVVGSGGIAPNAYPRPVPLLTDVFPGAAGGGGGACTGSFRQITYFSAQNVCSGDPLFSDLGNGAAGGLVYTGNGANFDAENSGSYQFTGNDPSAINNSSNFGITLNSNGQSAANFNVSTTSNSFNSGNINLVTHGSAANGDSIFLTTHSSAPSPTSGAITLEGSAISLLADNVNINLRATNGIIIKSGSQPTSFINGIAPTTTVVTTTPYAISSAQETTTFYNASGGNIIANLPTTPLIDGTLYIQKKVDSSANTVTITPHGGAIDGAASYVLKAQYQWVALQYDLTIGDWHVFASGPFATGTLTAGHCVQVDATGTTFIDSGVVGCSGAGGGGSAFNALTSGVNTTFTGTVGTGATINRSGTGVIDASAIGGITITGTPSVGFVPTATGSTTATWQAGPTAPAFSAITTGTSTVPLHMGAGGTLDTVGGGTIAATTAINLATTPTVCGANQYAAGVGTNGNAICIALPTQPASQYIAPQAISGCGVEYVSGLSYNVGACTYSINGTIYHSPFTPVTLSTADPTNPRFDTIFVDTTQTVQVLPGTPAANPAQPSVNPSTQLALDFPLIPAGATTPANTTLVDIYLEGVEWTGATGGTNATRVNLTSTNNPFTGTHDVEYGVGGTVAATTFAGFTDPAAGTVNLANYNTLTFYIRNKAAWLATNSITVQWFNGATLKGTGVVLSNGAFGYDAVGNTTSYQQVSIPTSTFGIAGIPVTSVRFTVSGSGAALTGFYLDQVTLQGGSGGVILPTTLMNFKGAWSSTATYNPNDTVTSGGAGYVALAQNTNVAVTTAATWAPLAPSGVVSSFSAVPANWPLWLVPSVANGTSTPSLSVTASPIPYSALTNLAANTVLGALTGTTPSGLPMPSCSTAGTSALTWTSGVGFGCNAISGGGGGSSVGTAGQLQMVGSTAGSFAASHATDNGTSFNISEPTTVNDGTGNAGSIGLLAGTAPGAAPANTVQISAPASVTAYSVTLPSTQGTGVLTNNGSGALSWTAASSIPGTATVESFGAVGYTTLAAAIAGTDSTSSLQACLNSFNGIGGQCLLAAKYYRITSALSITHSGVGLKGVVTQVTNSTIIPAPVASAIVTTSASADLIDVAGVDAAHAIGNNRFEYLALMRSTAPSGTATGLSLNYTYGVYLDGVVSEDSVRGFYIHGSGSIGVGDIINSTAQWGYNGVTETSGNFYGFYEDSADGNASPSLRVRNTFVASTLGATPVTYGYYLAGTAINDLMNWNFESSGTTYGIYVSYTGSGTFSTETDIHFYGPILDTCVTSCIYVTGLTSAGAATLQFVGGWAYSTTGNSVDIESSSGVQINGMQVIGGPNPIYVNGSSNISIVGNTLPKNGSNGIVLNNTTNSTVSGNVVVGNTGANNLIYLTASSSNSVSNNTVSGLGVTGIYLDGNSNNNTGLDTNVVASTLTATYNNIGGNPLSVISSVTGTPSVPACGGWACLTTNDNSGIGFAITGKSSAGAAPLSLFNDAGTQAGLYLGGSANATTGYRNNLFVYNTVGDVSIRGNNHVNLIAGNNGSATNGASLIGAGNLDVASGGQFAWSSTTDSTGTRDTGLSRGAAGEVDCGNGTALDKSCTIKAASLLVTGIADGEAPVTVTTGTTATLGGTYKSGYTFNQEATAATAVAYTLPTAAAGLQYCVGNSYNGTAATTGVLTVNTSAAGQFIIFTDGTLSATGGNVTSGGAAADFACFVGVDSTHWYFKPSSGTWTKH